MKMALESAYEASLNNKKWEKSEKFKQYRQRWSLTYVLNLKE